jgi:hypothetical protein
VERWQMVIAGTKKFDVVPYVIVGGSGGVLPQKHFIFFHPLEARTAFCAFSETDFCI